jgi:hypothetical protein
MPQPGVSVRRDDPEREPNRLREPGSKTRAHLTVLDGRSALDDMDLASRSATPRPERAASPVRAPRAANAPRPAAARPPLAPARAFDDEARSGGVPGRRTITITGHGAERYASSTHARPRSQRRRHERPGFQPDRFAMWAVLLGVLLLLVAATSSHAAMLSPHAGAHVALVAHAHIR